MGNLARDGRAARRVPVSTATQASARIRVALTTRGPGRAASGNTRRARRAARRDAGKEKQSEAVAGATRARARARLTAACMTANTAIAHSTPQPAIRAERVAACGCPLSACRVDATGAAIASAPSGRAGAKGPKRERRRSREISRLAAIVDGGLDGGGARLHVVAAALRCAAAGGIDREWPRVARRGVALPRAASPRDVGCVPTMSVSRIGVDVRTHTHALARPRPRAHRRPRLRSATASYRAASTQSHLSGERAHTRLRGDERD
jgi:hypothetical protein